MNLKYQAAIWRKGVRAMVQRLRHSPEFLKRFPHDWDEVFKRDKEAETSADIEARPLPQVHVLPSLQPNRRGGGK